MIQPNIDARPVKAWIVCPKCNNAYHRILPGDKTPYWWCQDEVVYLGEGQEIEYQEEER